MKRILSTLSLILVTAFIASVLPVQANSLPVGGSTYYLSGAGVTSSATSIQLTSLKTADGRNIAMTDIGTTGYGTLEPGTTARIENIVFTGIVQNGNGTATLTGVSRGTDFLYPYAASSTLAKSHAGGAPFIITNTAKFYYDEFAMNNNNVIVWPTASTSVAQKGYVDYVAFNGAGVINADTSNKGVVQLGTTAQIAASTALGSTGAALVIPASAATSTYNSATPANRVVVTGLTGKIDSNFIATSTLYGSAAGTGLASTTYIGDFPAYQIGKNVQTFTNTGTTTFSVPSGVTKFSVEVQGGGAGSPGCTGSGSGCQSAGGGSGGWSTEIVDLTGTSTINVHVGVAGEWSTFGTNGFYLAAAGGVTDTAGCGTGGDINTCGQNGGPSLSSGGATLRGGDGGSSRFGGGARGTYGSGAGTASSAFAYGAGGGGGGATGSNSGGGAAGTAGIVIVRW